MKKILPVVMSHYKRWIFNTPGPFQVRGWGCKHRGQYVKTGMNHMEFLIKKLNRELGDNHSYCNAITDTDLWIIAGVTHLLAAHKKSPDLVLLSKEDKHKFSKYIHVGMDLIKSRVTYKNLKNFEGKSVRAANFDLGAWDEHPDYAWVWY